MAGKWVIEDDAPKGQWVVEDAPAQERSKIADTGNAVGTGYFRGLTRLAALPVDTAANVLDLGKAAIGAPYIALTGKAPPSWLEVGNRANILGSGDNLVRNISKTRAGGLINPANPEYEGGYAQAIGGGMNGVIRPNTVLQGVNQAVNSVAGTAAGKGVFDVTGSVPLAIAAGMSPTAIQSGSIDLTQRAIRGGEAGRKAMEQRIQDLKAAGIDNPTMGLASGNRLIGGIENLLQNTPGAVGVMRRSRDAAVGGLERKTAGAAETASPQRGALEAGTAIQGGITSFRDNFKTQQGLLYDKMDAYIPGQTPTNVTGTKGALAALNADIPGAPELSKQFKNARIMSIEAAMKSDTAGTPAIPGTAPSPSLLLGSNGQPAFMSPGRAAVPAGPSSGLLPFEAVKKTRTLVGNEIADGGLMADVPRSKWNAMYGALSGDMQAVANANGPQATQAFNRATDYTRAGIGRLDRVAPFADKVAPEQAFTSLMQSTRENVSTLQAVKKTLPEGARGTVAGTVIERLGKANNGVQNELGTAWSPDTFLTNWNKMTPQAQNELFSGFKNSAQVMGDVSAVAKATSMMRENSNLWANPSGTGANLAARGLLGAVGAGSLGAAGGLLNPMVPLGAGAAMLGANGLARGLTNRTNVDNAAKNIYIDPRMLNSQVNSLIGSGLLNYQP